MTRAKSLRISYALKLSGQIHASIRMRVVTQQKQQIGDGATPGQKGDLRRDRLSSKNK